MRAALSPGLLAAGIGVPACVAASVLDPGGARSSASQVWPAFVLVAGLIALGAVASACGLFEVCGRLLARAPGGEIARFSYACALVAVISAALNLDTAALFVTPVLVHMARTRGRGLDAVLYGSLLLTNAGSMLLPGSNLTNIIVTGHERVSGIGFASHMALPWLCALAVTAVVVAFVFRPGTACGEDERADRAFARRARAETWISAALAVAAAVVVVALRNAALPVLVIGAVAVVFALGRRLVTPSGVARTLDAPMLVGLMGIAITLGIVGRAWDGPARLLGHSGSFATAGVAAAGSIAVNNLPAASLLAARAVPHPYALLVGLDVGPNLFVTGSLSAYLWFRSAKSAGAHPSVLRIVGVGVVAGLAAGAAAVWVLGA